MATLYISDNHKDQIRKKIGGFVIDRGRDCIAFLSLWMRTVFYSAVGIIFTTLLFSDAKTLTFQELLLRLQSPRMFQITLVLSLILTATALCLKLGKTGRLFW